jgi:RNA polymerase sigma factor (TIGR02999 family)
VATKNDDTHRVTRLLEELRAGRSEVAGELAELVYEDLLRTAAQRMGARQGVTLEPAALVNECWIRLARQRCDFENRSHFLAIASRLMLRVLLDADRRRAAVRRGGEHERVTLSFEVSAAEDESGVEVLPLQEALEQLERVAPRKAEVARLRGLGGLTIAETAAELGVSEATVERDWSFARAWLSRQVARLREEPAGPRAAEGDFSPDR